MCIIYGVNKIQSTPKWAKFVGTDFESINYQYGIDCATCF
jgi:hypothetical protein